MSSVAKYLKPEVARQIKRLDLRAEFIVKGFLQGLHASPFQGFSVEFSEHRKYVPGDDPLDIDWLVYAKTDKYYVKKFEAETNITGFLAIDASRSMGYTHRGEMTKFDYAVCLAAALCYLMIRQQDPVGLWVFDEVVRRTLAPQSRKSQLGNVLSVLAKLTPTGKTDIVGGLNRMSGVLHRASLIMIFSDLLAEEEPIIKALYRLKHRGHDVIVFHIMDEAEVRFPFTGMVELEDPETLDRLEVDATGVQAEYLRELEQFRERYRRECLRAGIDYVPLDTSMPFDKALTEYLLRRRARF